MEQPKRKKRTPREYFTMNPFVKKGTENEMKKLGMNKLSDFYVHLYYYYIGEEKPNWRNKS